MERKHLWWIGGGFVGLLLLSATKTVSTTVGSLSVTDEDLDNLARMLVSETSFARDTDEMASIVQVAINRAKARGISLSKVLVPPGVPTWNPSANYRALFNAAKLRPAFYPARGFALDVLLGKYPNQIGNRQHFVHPTGMPKPPNCSANHVVAMTFAGERCMPPFALTASQLRVGGAIFA